MAFRRWTSTEQTNRDMGPKKPMLRSVRCRRSVARKRMGPGNATDYLYSARSSLSQLSAINLSHYQAHTIRLRTSSLEATSHAPSSNWAARDRLPFAHQTIRSVLRLQRAYLVTSSFLRHRRSKHLCASSCWRPVSCEQRTRRIKQANLMPEAL